MRPTARQDAPPPLVSDEENEDDESSEAGSEPPELLSGPSDDDDSTSGEPSDPKDAPGIQRGGSLLIVLCLPEQRRVALHCGSLCTASSSCIPHTDELCPVHHLLNPLPLNLLMLHITGFLNKKRKAASQRVTAPQEGSAPFAAAPSKVICSAGGFHHILNSGKGCCAKLPPPCKHTDAHAFGATMFDL